MTLTLSHGGDTIFTSSAPSTEVLVGTTEGVVRIQKDQSGSKWQITDKWLTGKHIHAVIVEPVSGTIFAGATQDSVYASEDSGRTWERRDKGLTLSRRLCTLDNRPIRLLTVMLSEAKHLGRAAKRPFVLPGKDSGVTI